MVMEPQEYYARCNLTNNPFLSTPTFAADPRAGIWVGYDREREVLVKYLRRSRADQIGNGNFIMVFGPYGTGKSHALLWARNYVQNQKSAEYDALCYFIPTLRQDKGKLTFAGAFLNDIVGRSTLVQDVGAFRVFLRHCVSQYRVENGIEADVSDSHVLTSLIPYPELRVLADQIDRSPGGASAPDWLTAAAANDYQAMMMFTRLVNLFTHPISRHNGAERRFKKAVYLFMDELDDLGRTSSKETRDMNDILRHIYDNCPRCFCMVIALTAEVAQLPAMFFDYVMSRIQRHIPLPVLDKDEAVSFVRDILDSSRVDRHSSTGFFPFEETAIDGIASSITEITPRKIVNAMQQVLEDVRLAGHDPSRERISLGFLEEHYVLDEIVG